MTTVSLITSPDGERKIAKISLSWTQVTERFSARFEEQFQGKRKAHFDTLPEPFRTVDGAKGKWMLLVMLDAMVYLLENDQPIESARRYFHQQRVLCESVMAEVGAANAEIKATFGPEYPVEVFIENLESPWNSCHAFRELHANSTPTKAKQKFLTVLDMLLNHRVITNLQGNMIPIITQTVSRVMNCWSTFEEPLGPPPNSSPSLSRRSMSADSSSFDYEEEVSSPGLNMMGALRPFFQAQRRRSHSPTQMPSFQQQYPQPVQHQQPVNYPLPVKMESNMRPPSLLLPSSNTIAPSVQPQYANIDQMCPPLYPTSHTEVPLAEGMEDVFDYLDNHQDRSRDGHIENSELMDMELVDHNFDFDAFMSEVAHSSAVEDFMSQHYNSTSTDSFNLAGLRTATFSNSDNQIRTHYSDAIRQLTEFDSQQPEGSDNATPLDGKSKVLDDSSSK